MINVVGSHIAKSLLPTLRRLVSGANNIVHTHIKPDLGEGTRALVNRILNAILARCKFEFQRTWILFTTRIALCSEHVCITRNKSLRYVMRYNVIFHFEGSNPVSLIIDTGKDKNHETNKKLHRTVSCTCDIKQACIIHQLYDYIKNNNLDQYDCLLPSYARKNNKKLHLKRVREQQIKNMLANSHVLDELDKRVPFPWDINSV